jgi:hypothetical protein
MICEKCGVETEGYRRRGPSHPVIPYCKICYNPKRWKRCGECKATMTAGCRVCRSCRKRSLLIAKVVRLNTELQVAQMELNSLGRPTIHPASQAVPLA